MDTEEDEGDSAVYKFLQSPKGGLKVNLPYLDPNKKILLHIKLILTL